MFRLVALALAAAACGGTSSHAETITVPFQVASADATGGAISLTAASGTAYTEFLTAAEAEIGDELYFVEVDEVRVTLLPTSTGVAALDEVFTGDIVVSFLINGARSFDVGRGAAAGTTVSGGPEYNFNLLSGVEREAMLSGNFEVVVSGTPAAGFAAAGATAELSVELDFEAF
jgi:hypothetical protein